MWPLFIALMRRYAVYITLPIAGAVGFVGYNLENLISDKYTPYNESIQEHRAERLSAELDAEVHAGNLKLRSEYAGVLERNLSPSLQKKT